MNILATEEGIVTKVDSTTAWVTTVKSSACESCAARSSCSTLENGREMKVEAINTFEAMVGDRVVIYFETSSLLKLSFLLYVFPILIMITGAIIGHKIAPFFNFDRSLLSAVCGFLFLFLSFVFIKSKGSKLSKKNKYKPKIIKILAQKNQTPT